MTTVASILRRARRRVMTADAVHRAGLGLMSASGLALVVLIGERAAGLGWPWWIYVVAMGSGVVLGALFAVMVPPERFDMAVKLDRALGLRDRIASAEIARHDASRAGVFGPLVEQDAQRVAQRVDVRAATPIRITRVWFGAAGAALLLAIGMPLMPVVDWSSPSNDTTTVAMHTPETVEQQELIADEIERAVAGIDTEQPLDPDLQQELDRLSELAEQLSANTATPDELSAARDDAAATLDDIADRIADDAQRDLDATEAATERFSGLKAAEAPMTAQEFAQALRNGEFGDAASLFEDLRRDAESLPPAEREALADGLRELGDQLNPPTIDGSPDDAEAMRGALRDLGLDDEQIDELLNEDVTREEIEELLDQHDLDEDVAREVTDDVRDAAEQQSADREAEQTARDLSEAIDRAADEIDPTPPAEQPQTTDEQTPAAEAPSDQTEDQPTADHEQTQQPQAARDSAGRDAQPEQPGAQSNQQQDQPGAEQPGAQSKQQQDQPGAEQSGTEQSGTDQSGAEQSGTEQSGTDQSGAEQSGAEQPGSPIDPGDQTDPQRSPDEDASIDPGNGASQPGAPESGDRQPTVEELLEELNKRQRGGRDRARDSEEIREAARRIAEQMTDEEKRELAERWMNSADPDDVPGASSAGINRRDPDSSDRPFAQTEQVDLRGDDDEPGQHTIAEWIDDQPLEGDPQRTTRSSKIARSAQTAAERAVDEAVVPRRYHGLIQRYFQRMPETIDKAATTTTNGGANTSGSSAQSSEGGSQTTGNDS